MFKIYKKLNSFVLHSLRYRENQKIKLQLILIDCYFILTITTLIFILLHYKFEG